MIDRLFYHSNDMCKLEGRLPCGQIHFGCLDGALGKEAIRAVIDGKNTAIWKTYFASQTNTFCNLDKYVL